MVAKPKKRRDNLAELLSAAATEAGLRSAPPKAPAPIKRRRRRRKAPDPLKPALKEARRLKREINVRLSQAFSEALGFGVKVVIAASVPASPAMKRARKRGDAFQAFNAP